MVDTVHMFVQPFCMEDPMSPVEYKILKDEVENYLCQNHFPAKPKTDPAKYAMEEMYNFLRLRQTDRLEK